MQERQWVAIRGDAAVFEDGERGPYCPWQQVG